MPTVHREIESKYEPRAGAALPHLDRLPGVASVQSPVEQELEAVYFDTAEHALTAAGVTVRRRTGGDDDGWHLELPSDDGHRDELRLPLGRAIRTVPKPLRMVVRAHSHDRSLGPVATIRTHRTLHRLLDADARVLAEVCDDAVSATGQVSQGGATALRWREWEVELVDGSPRLLESAGDLLQKAGAVPSAESAKLIRALGQAVPENGVPGRRRMKPGAAAGAVVLERLREQLAELKLRDAQVRGRAPGGVHGMRVALRRLRSALATFRPFLDREVTEPLRDELSWVASALASARDAEVMRAELTRVISAEPAGLVRRSVSSRVEAELRRAEGDAHRAAMEMLNSARYLAALDALDQLVTEPPWTAKAQQPGRKVLPQRVRREWKRMARRVVEAERASTGPHRDVQLHEVRKAAKRTRYAAEVLVPICRQDASRFARAVKKLQGVLGDHHDSVVSQSLLEELGTKPDADGPDAFGFGRLHRSEQDRAEAAHARFTKVWAGVARKKRRRWLG